MGAHIAGRSPVTVGRDAELAAIEGLLAEARSGRGRCLILLGEPGSGKTRLLREAAARAASKGAVVLAADVPATIAPPPFGTLAHALRSWIRDRRIDALELEGFAPGLRRVLPEWPAAPPDPELGTDQLRLLALEGALRLMVLAARGVGAVLILDDLQSVDPETLEFVHRASASIEHEPVAILAAARRGEGAGAETEARSLEQRGRAAVLEIAPLDAFAVSSMVEAILDAPAPPGLVDELMARTDGIPLLVEELLEAHVARGTIRREGGALSWSGPGRGIVPGTILETVRQKLRSLPPDCRRVVEAAAVLERADADLVGDVTGLADERVAEALNRAIDAGLLETVAGLVFFRHALIMEAAQEALLPAERDGLHRRAVQAIHSVHGEDPAWLEERARHHEAVGDRDGAAALLLGAGRRDLAAHAPTSAEATLRRALDLAPSREVAALLRDALASALGALGRWDQALRVDEQELARCGESAGRLARMARNALRTGRLEDADDLIRRACAGGADPRPLRVLSALVSLWRGDLERAVQTASDALTVGEQDPGVVCDALDVIGRASDMLGRREQAIASFRRWIEVADGAGLTASRLQALMELGNVEFMSTYVPDRLHQARALAREAGAYTTLVLADLSLVWCLGATGDLGEAIEIGQEALALTRRFELDLLPHVLEALGWARGRRAHGSGDAMIEEAVALAPTDADILVQAHDARGDWMLRAGRYEEALDQFDRALDVMRSNPSVVPMATPSMRASALLASGRREEAAAALEDARALSVRPRLLIVPLWLEATAALLARSGDALERAVPPDTTVRYERATILVLGAQIIGGPDVAGWFREALGIYERAGAVDDAARVRRLMRAHGAPVPRTRPMTAALPEPLRARGVTRREAQVLQLIGRGRSNGEIAQKLFLSVRTVESHVSSLLAKLGAENRGALIALALSLKPTT